MTSIAYSLINIQACAQSAPALPCWFGEITLLVQHLQRQGVLAKITEQVRFARRRFGRYDVIDFVAILFGYAISGERTLQAFYERIEPWADPFMALFGRDRLPARSTLSRFLSALDQSAVEALRTLFLNDLLARPLSKEEQPDGLFDRQGNHFRVFDVDGTKLRPLANGPCRRLRINQPQHGASTRCAHPDTRDASAGKSCALGPRYSRPIPTNGWPALARRATDNTGSNCAGR